MLCKNPNWINNRLTGNEKLNKAIDIKEELKADSILYSKHRLNLCHKKIKMTSNKCSNGKLHAEQSHATTSTMGLEECRKVAQAWWPLAT